MKFSGPHQSSSRMIRGCKAVKLLAGSIVGKSDTYYFHVKHHGQYNIREVNRYLYLYVGQLKISIHLRTRYLQDDPRVRCVQVQISS